MESGCEVVVTGWDVICPLGVGKEAFGAAIWAGTSGVRRLPWLDASAFPVKFGGSVPDFDGKQFVQPRKSLKVMSREIQMGFAACALASADARISAGQIDPDRLGVIFASEMIYPEVDELADAYRASMQDGEFEFPDWGRKGLARLYPLWLLKYLPNMVACHVGIALDARGPNNSICAGEISSLLAIHEAYHVIQRGLADVMVVGGIGSRLHVTPLIFRTIDPLSHRNDAPEAACRPFDVGRDGIVNGEGAVALVLERRAHAEARGGSIHARVLGGASSYDQRYLNDSTAAFARAIRLTLERSGLDPRNVGHVNAHGLSSRDTDMFEARAIRQELGDVRVTAPKSYFGHLGAGSGLVELCTSLLAFATGRIPRTLNCVELDPECPIRLCRDEPVPLGPPVAIKITQSSTGATAAVAIAAP